MLPEQARVFILRFAAATQILEPQPDVLVREGDVIAVIGRQEIHVTRGNMIGPEVSDPGLLDIPIESLDVVITNRGHGRQVARGIGASSVRPRRVPVEVHPFGIEMPILPESRVDRGDVVRLIGPLPEVERAAKELGYPDRRTSATDMVFVGTGHFSRRPGRPAFDRGLGYTADAHRERRRACHGSGLRLAAGRSTRFSAAFRNRRSGSSIPSDFACSSASSASAPGRASYPGLQASGVSLVFVGLVSALLPHTIGILFGRYVLKMDPLIVLGACAGAGTITAALRAVQDEAQSSIPALGYTVPYAVGNILLTAWGPVLVAMMSI